MGPSAQLKNEFKYQLAKMSEEIPNQLPASSPQWQLLSPSSQNSPATHPPPRPLQSPQLLPSCEAYPPLPWTSSRTPPRRDRRRAWRRVTPLGQAPGAPPPSPCSSRISLGGARTPLWYCTLSRTSPWTFWTLSLCPIHHLPRIFCGCDRLLLGLCSGPMGYRVRGVKLQRLRVRRLGVPRLQGHRNLLPSSLPSSLSSAPPGCNYDFIPI